MLLKASVRDCVSSWGTQILLIMQSNADSTAPYSRWPRELIAGEVTGSVIGAFYEVYNHLGPGFLEAVYATAIEVEFHLRGIPYERELGLKVFYKHAEVGSYRADFLVAGQVLLEIKTGREPMEPAKSQLLNYLRATDTEVGLVLKFGQKATFERMINSARRRSAQIS